MQCMVPPPDTPYAVDVVRQFKKKRGEKAARVRIEGRFEDEGRHVSAVPRVDRA